MAHLKRYAMPVHWQVKRKERAWIIRPSSGPHPIKSCIPLQIILRNMLGYAKTAKEVRTILNAGNVLVDKRIRKDPGYPAGLMDVIEIPAIKKHFTVTMGRHGLELKNASENEASAKLCRIEDKKKTKGGLMQLCLHDGRNLLLDNKGTSYSTGDSIIISLPDQKITKHVKLEKGAKVLVIAGKNMGVIGHVAEINKRTNMIEDSIIRIKHDKNEINTQLSYVVAVE